MLSCHRRRFCSLFTRKFISHRRSCEPGEILIPQQHPFDENQWKQSLNESDFLEQLSRNGSLSDPYFLNQCVSFSSSSKIYFPLGVQLHSVVVKLGHVSNVHVCTSLVDMYGKSGEVMSSWKLFNEMPDRTKVTWGALIFACLNAQEPEMATRLFRDMLREEVDVEPVHVSVCLVGCSQLEDQILGTQVHALILKCGFSANVVVSTNLIDLYSKCYEIDNAKLVFDESVDKNVITWTSMVTGYVQNEQPDDAMILVREMIRSGMGCNCITYSSLLSSFSGPEYLSCCLQVHGCVLRLGLESNPYVAASLITVYSKCGSNLVDFRKVSFGFHRQDKVSWNAILSGYCNLGLLADAVDCFRGMKRVGIDDDMYAFTSLLGAAGDSSALDEGKEFHACIIKTGFASNLCVQNGLVSMYARCGAITDSKTVFWLMEHRDVISWNALLTGCAHHGYGNDTVDLFEFMKQSNVRPNSTTLLVVLSACSHAGLISKGLKYVYSMKKDGFLRSLREEHFSAIVDIIARSGHLKEAESFIEEVLIRPGQTVYKSLLSACLVHGDTEIAANTAKKLLQNWPTDPATYVLVSRALAQEGYWHVAADMRNLMSSREVTKHPGSSWV